MKIGVLGIGDVEKRLGSGFISIGHEVMLGSRDPKSEKVALATLGSGTEEALKLAGPTNFSGKGTFSRPYRFSRPASAALAP